MLSFSQSDIIPNDPLNRIQSTNFLSSQQEEFNNILQLFQQKRYFLFLKESSYFQKKHPRPIEEILWLQAHANLQINNTNQAMSLLIPLTNSINTDIKHRSLLDLYQIYDQNQQYSQGISILSNIHYSSEISPYKELAHLKYISTSLKIKNYKQADILLESFEYLYPHSSYLEELQYFIAQHNLKEGNIKRAKSFALKIMNNQTNLSVQKLLGEIELQEKNYQNSLKYYLPISEYPNKYQDESLYKTALLYKYLKNYQEAHKKLSQLVKYYQNSSYFNRAYTELANINIILRNYDDALVYFLRESRYTGSRSALALLKIAEINFLKTNTVATRRTADRIQRSFPYSAFANEAIYWVGRSYLLDKEYQKSIEIFGDYLIREPQSLKKDEILIFLGHAYANLDNQPKARSYFQDIVNTSSNAHLKRQALMGLGRSYNIKEPQRSLEYFDRVWKIWPTAPESDKAIYYSAAIRYNLRQNQDSLKLFKQLTNNFPSSLFYQDSILAIAKLEFKNENFGNILEIDTIPLNSKNKEQVAEFKELQARSLFRIQEYEKALKLFQEASKLSNNKTRIIDLSLAEASTLRALGKHHEAVKNYERYLKNTQDFNNLEDLLWAEIAFSYIEIKELSKAEKNIAYLFESYPNSSYITDLYYKLADEYFSQNNYNKAALFYNKARISNKNNSLTADILLREAWSLYKNNANNTKEILTLFLDKYPNHFGAADIMYKLAELNLKDDDNETLFYTLINKHPDSPESETARIYLAEKLNQTNSIDEFYQALSSTKDKKLRARYLFKLGNKMEKEDMKDEAIQIYKDIHVLRDPALGADALLLAGQILTSQQQYKDALQLYVNIIANYDEKYYSKALDYIIQTYIFLEDYDNAEKFKARLLEQFPNSKESKKWK